MSGQAFIPERFRREVALHIYKNHSALLSSEAPLILGISGPPGQGKTFNVESCLREFGVRATLLSGGQLEQVDAGKPAELIRDAYEEASRAMERDVKLNGAALVINDVDTGVGDWGELVQYTVNRQTVFGELMHLCDFPNRVNNKPCRRIPIILTGNNFTSLYGPLLRPGRMNAFSWEPTEVEQFTVLRSVLSGFKDAEIRLLLETFPRQPISFFAYVKGALVNNLVWTRINEAGVPAALAFVRQGREVQTRPDVDLNKFVVIGHQIAREHEFQNYVPAMEATGGKNTSLHPNGSPA